jgi:hypothetical protein
VQLNRSSSKASQISIAQGKSTISKTANNRRLASNIFIKKQCINHSDITAQVSETFAYIG